MTANNTCVKAPDRIGPQKAVLWPLLGQSAGEPEAQGAEARCCGEADQCSIPPEGPGGRAADDKRPVQGVGDAPGPDPGPRVVPPKYPRAEHEVPRAKETPQIGMIPHAERS